MVEEERKKAGQAGRESCMAMKQIFVVNMPKAEEELKVE
jgi:hypothetical protein